MWVTKKNYNFEMYQQLIAQFAKEQKFWITFFWLYRIFCV